MRNLRSTTNKDQYLECDKVLSGYHLSVLEVKSLPGHIQKARSRSCLFGRAYSLLDFYTSHMFRRLVPQFLYASSHMSSRITVLFLRSHDFAVRSLDIRELCFLSSEL
jgi:hypothetical protein